MNEYGLRPKTANLDQLGLSNITNAYWNLTPAELVEETVIRGMGVLSDTGAVAIDTGEFTGRSPKDRFIVCDSYTENAVWWGDINIKFSSENFDSLYDKVTSYLQNKDIFVRDSYACSDERFKLNIRVVNMIGEFTLIDNLEQFSGKYAQAVNLTTKASGVYFLEIITDDGVVNHKLILQ